MSMPNSALCLANALEVAMERQTMPLKPRVKVKARGIPIGSYDAVVDAAGKAVIKPKRKARSTPQQIMARKKRKWKAAK